MPVYNEEYITQGLTHPLFVRQWIPDGEIYGLVQICHGMMEHGGRYDKLGNYLASHGFAAFCHDHRGHGRTCLEGEQLGYFADKDGWDVIVNDAVELGGIMRQRYPDGPFILFGHSMGSLVVSTISAMGRETFYSGYILCGSPSPNPMAKMGMAMADGMSKIGLAKKPNIFFHALAFADPKKLFKRRVKKDDWLSTNDEELEKYRNDPLCGFHFTTSGFHDLLDGLSRVRNDKWALRTECKPFLLISGDMDPVGGYGKAARWIDDQLKAVGRRSTCILYQGKRHEILNERDCDQTYVDILKWILEVYNHG